MKSKTDTIKAQELLDKYYDKCGLHNEGVIKKVGGLMVYNDGFNVMVIDKNGYILVSKKLY